MLKRIGLTLISVGIVAVANADLSYTETLANFGTFSQLNAGVLGADNLRANACVPTSVANGLYYLNQTYGVPGLMQAGYGTVNSLVTDMGTTPNGTSNQGLVTGLNTYLGPTGQNVNPPVSIVGGQIATGYGTIAGNNFQNNTNPTAMQLYNWLKAKDAVEFGIYWSTADGRLAKGAHQLTLYGIDINTNGNGIATGTGTLSFLDPFGGVPVAGGNNGSAVNIVNASYKTLGGQLFISGGYLGGASDNGLDPDNATKASNGYILDDVAEGVTPEPATFLPFGLGLAGLAFKRRKAVAR